MADASQILSIGVKDENTPENKDQPASATRTIVPDPVAEVPIRRAGRRAAQGDRLRHRRRLAPDPATLVNATGDQKTARRPLWPPLVGFALGLWFLDLLFRRIRVFE